jgi:hypothetical protein
MNEHGAARTQHNLGAAQREETEDGAAPKARPVRKTKASAAANDPALGVPGLEMHILAARAEWLETVRALARAAAQQDHDAALRLVQGNRDEKGE